MTRSVKAATAIGIVVACVGILGAAMMEGTSPTAFLNMPAMILVFGGTFGATLAACGMDAMKKIPAFYKIAFAGAEHHLAAKVHELVGFAEKARKDGLLALESELEEIEDAFTKKGMQLVVDGTDPDLVREILEVEVDAMAMRHKEGAEVFKTAGGFAPTMGIIGTVMGLVHVLQHLSAPETLGPSISGAFIATLMGVGAANVVFLPVASRLKGLSHEELHVRNLVLEGILSIQAGDNPRVVSEKLMSLVPPGRAPVGRGGRQAEPASRRRSRRRRRGGRLAMARNSGRRRMGGEEEAEESDERWLLTYADMITLLMALFMVLFSISSVNVSKFVTLQRSLQDAFSGRILPGGRAPQESGGSTTSPKVAATPPTSTPAVTADGAAKAKADAAKAAAAAAKAEEKDFKALKARVDAYVDKHGLASKVTTHRHQGRPRHPPAHRQAAVRQRLGDGAARRARPARRRSARSCAPRTST